MEEQAIVNRVSNSSLVSLDLDELLSGVESIFFDLKPFLFREMILREKDFRTAIKEHDWLQYQGMSVVIGCSVEAIIPTWAYMLVTSKLINVAKSIVSGSVNDLEKARIDQMIDSLDKEEFQGKKIVIKGCGDLQLRDYAFVEITKLLLPIVSSLMYGEPCSTVPVYKKPRVQQ